MTTTARDSLPTIVRYHGISDGGPTEGGNWSFCPHCGAKGRYIHWFEVETDSGSTERRGAMSGCVKMFPISYVAAKHKALIEKEREHAKRGWTLNKSEAEMVAVIERYYADEITRDEAEHDVRRLSDRLAAWRQEKYGGRRR